ALREPEPALVLIVEALGERRDSLRDRQRQLVRLAAVAHLGPALEADAARGSELRAHLGFERAPRALQRPRVAGLDPQPAAPPPPRGPRERGGRGHPAR